MNTLDLSTLAAHVAAAGAPTSVLSGALPALKLLAVSGVREHFTRQQSPGGEPWKPLARPRPDGSGTILRDRGQLLASVGASVTVGQLVLFASHPGAAVHQFGATITPRTAKMLAVPVTTEAKRVGGPRQNRFPRPLFPYVSRTGLSTFLAEQGPDGRLVLHYLLRRSVTVPARPYLGFSAGTLSKMERLLADRLIDWIARAFLAETKFVESWGISI